MSFHTLPKDVIRYIIARHLTEVDRLYFRFTSKDAFLVWTPEFVKRGESFGHVLYHDAVQNGHLNRLERLYSIRSRPPKFSAQYLAIIAAEKGHLDILQWLHSRLSVTLTEKIAAASTAHLHVWSWLISEGCPIDDMACTTAAKHGNLAAIRYARKYLSSVPQLTFPNAAGAGHLAVLQYALAEGLPITASAAHSAAYNGQLECLRFVLEHGTGTDVNDEIQMTAKAAQGGHFECLRYMIERGLAVSGAEVSRHAANNADRKVLNYLHSKHLLVPSSNIIMGACVSGDIALLEWLVSLGCTLTHKTCAQAAFCGRLDLLQWMVEQGAPLHPDVTYSAAAKGHVEALRFVVVEKGCAWHAQALAAAVEASHVDAIKFALQHNAPGQADVIRRAKSLADC